MRASLFLAGILATLAVVAAPNSPPSPAGLKDTKPEQRTVDLERLNADDQDAYIHTKALDGLKRLDAVAVELAATGAREGEMAKNRENKVARRGENANRDNNTHQILVDSFVDQAIGASALACNGKTCLRNDVRTSISLCMTEVDKGRMKVNELSKDKASVAGSPNRCSEVMWKIHDIEGYEGDVTILGGGADGFLF
ncbi:hypothetical protein CORC01_12711 [Colletotrichum orchidophilum]|uniref:Uncharacterized protein n=1 Tax=Colletotrichum orchidophilum TaxID=1209926 RepID=A0A1G4AS77_9PEZI|nr:uncharacterized protein CORC01_12711 [Colletotrichum orchidophilum]OHE91975.1 hypothetical protein CORC01_12711 [Colletotrichum orchidophilum]